MKDLKNTDEVVRYQYRQVELIVITTHDNTALKYAKCPSCGMQGAYYSSGIPKDHECSNCQKNFYC